MATSKNNTKIVQLLIKYANQHQIILELNEKENEHGDYPLLIATSKNNIDIVQLLLEYALHHQIILEYEKNDIKNESEIKILLQNYEKEIEKWKKVIK